MRNLTENPDEYEFGNIFSKESWELKSRDDFMVAAAIAMNDFYTGYYDESSATRSEWYPIILSALVHNHMRDYDNNHRATAPAGFISRGLASFIARDKSLSLDEKITYRGRVSSRCFAY